MQVGQKLWWVPNSRRMEPKGYEVEITKVGRRWIYLSNDERLDIEDGLQVDGRGYNPSGTWHLSESDYLREKELSDAWCDFMREVRGSWSRPAGVTLNDIRQARELLRLG